ncbi:MAG: helix-turn-helix domain-containing protein [Syntrophales bacterium]
MVRIKNKITDMSPTDIRIALLRRGVTQTDIALEQNVSKAAVYRTIEGKSKSHRLRTAIAEKTGLSIQKIWPSIYLNVKNPPGKGRPKSRIKKIP